jgi:hypothetical protein
LNAQKKNFRQGGRFEGVRSERRPVVCKVPSKQVILTVILLEERVLRKSSHHKLYAGFY